MTAAVLRSSPNLGVPPTQNTAPVHEFNCLYTHDLRRKQKRWQDGFLRYHTFNKRVMVYDVPRNFLGDLHWTSDDLQEGDEMTLEKGGIMVQVSDRIATTRTDLTDLLQRKDKTPARNPTLARPMVRHGTPLAAVPAITPRTPRGISPLPMKHKSLNALLGQSRRPIGKASLPSESPYEIRNREQASAETQSARSNKRQRLDVSAQNPRPVQHREVTPVSRASRRVTPSEREAEVIHISSDTEESLPNHAAERAIEAELLATSSPARLHDSPIPGRKVIASPHAINQNSKSVNNPVTESPSIRPPKQAINDAPLRPAAARTTKDAVLSKALDPIAVQKPAIGKTLSHENELPVVDINSQRPGKSLKLVGGAPRKMLISQTKKLRPQNPPADLDVPARATGQEVRPSTGKSNEGGALRVEARPQSEAPVEIEEPVEATFQQRIRKRMAHIEQKKRHGLQRSSSVATEQPINKAKASDRTGLRKTNSAVATRQPSPPPSELLSLLEQPMSDDTLSGAEDIVADPPAVQSVQPASRNPQPKATTTAKSFKPLTIKNGPAAAQKAKASEDKSKAEAAKKKTEEAKKQAEEAKRKAEEERRNADLGPWSKEAFDLMDWRPPNMQTA